MKGRRLSSLALAVLGCVGHSGCIEDVRFNAGGCDVNVRGRYFVDMQNPSAETCGNIAAVEFAIINEPETEFWTTGELFLNCDPEQETNSVVVDGGVYLNTAAVPRNRCGGTGEILRSQPMPYKYRWRAITNLNFIVDCTPILVQSPEEVDGGLLLDLPPAFFETQDGGVVCPN